jgi:hypothetical protein
VSVSGGAWRGACAVRRADPARDRRRGCADVGSRVRHLTTDMPP